MRHYLKLNIIMIKKQFIGILLGKKISFQIPQTHKILFNWYVIHTTQRNVNTNVGLSEDDNQCFWNANYYSINSK